MQKQFLKYCQSIGLSEQSTILVAVSGGLDSIALLHLFKLANFKISVAHCNFKLRGTESDADHDFVAHTCKQLNLPFFSKDFDTLAYAKLNSVSIQMAARELRYAWFTELRLSNAIDYIATAHHQDDQVETILLNLSRGTGLKGLHGILPIQNHLVRPLLYTDRAKLEAWMCTRKISYREDSSNASLKYARNKLRHKVLPVLKELNPSLAATMQQNAERFENSQQNLAFFYDKCRAELLKEVNGDLHFNLEVLQTYPAPIDVLFYFLSEYGFQDWKAISHLFRAPSGKVISSNTHELLKNRTSLVLKKTVSSTSAQFFIQEDLTSVSSPFNLTFKQLPNSGFKVSTNPLIAALDYDKLAFPLLLRKWKSGDVFQPLGMRGKKKLSDFFIDTKLSIFEKRNTWVLCSATKIVWVVGHRIDERFKLVENGQKVYLVELIKD